MARRKYIPLTESDVHFEFRTDPETKIPIITNISAREDVGLFLDPYEELGDNKNIFTTGEYCDEDGFYNIWTNSAYEYALASALIKKANDILSTRVGDSQKVEEQQQEERIPELDKAMLVWKESIAGNDKFIFKKPSLTPATRFYSGKQGVEIAKLAQLDSLADEQLLAIVEATKFLKRESSQEVKGEFSEDNPWITMREDYTPEGWRLRELKKYEVLHDLGILNDKDYNNKKKWAEEFDFYPGWNYEGKGVETNEVERVFINSNTIERLEDFNKYFVINAINKDKLWNNLSE